MHVIAFSDLDYFLGRLLCSSGDVAHHCTTLMAEFHLSVITITIMCDAGALCWMKLPIVPLSFGKVQS